MPKYKVKLSDGRSFVVTADAPPSEQDVLAQLGESSPTGEGAPPPDGFPAMMEKLNKNPLPMKDLAVAGADALPIVGGMAGASLGPLGAAAGGAGGEGLALILKALLGDTTVPATPQGVATDMGVEGILNGLTEGAGRFAGKVGPGLVKNAKGIYESALKPTKTLLKQTPAYGRGGFEEALDEILSTGLNERIPVSTEGTKILGKRITGLNNEVDSAIANSQATINPANIEAKLDDPLALFDNQLAPPPEDKAAIERVRQLFQNNPKVSDPVMGNVTRPSFNGPNGQMGMVTGPEEVGRAYRPISPQEANELKKGTYQNLKSKAYGEIKGAETEAHKALARGAKDEINTAVPTVKPLLSRESKLIALQDAIDDALPRIGNKETIGLKDMIVASTVLGSGGLTAAHSPLIAASIASRPTLASPIAIGLHEAGQALSASPETIRALTELLRLGAHAPKLGGATGDDSPTQQMIRDYLSQ